MISARLVTATQTIKNAQQLLDKSHTQQSVDQGFKLLFCDFLDAVSAARVLRKN